MYRAMQRGALRAARKLQQLLRKSWSARVLAVRRVPHDHRGKHTAGIDGVKSLPPVQRWHLANPLCLEGQATPRRRTWRPKRGRNEKRPLGMPTQHDRARQTVVRQALEPAWEAQLSPQTDGLRPGRSCWEAIAAIFHRMTLRPPYVLKVDIAKGFDRMHHDALLAKTPASPAIRRQLKAWLPAGVLEAGHVAPTTAGTPPGGTISPLLALIALHGMDEAITRGHPPARGMASADDCVVRHEDRHVLEQSQQLLRLGLAEIGLPLHATKSHICHTLEGEAPGCELLGFHIRQYRVGTHQSGKRPGGQRLGYPTLITPAKANIQEHLAELGRIMRRSKALPQSAVIRQLTPVIRGWAHSDRRWVSTAVYARLDALTWAKLRSWARRRHPTTTTPWVIQRSWHRRGTRLTFAPSATAPHAGHLHTHSEVPITRHSKVRGNRSPYDGDWVSWSTRQGRHPGGRPRLAMLRKQQRGRCASCGLFFH